MRRRRVARVTTGVAVGTVALTSLFAGTAWAPKVTLVPPPTTKDECKAEVAGEPPGYELEGFHTLDECLAKAKELLKEAKADAKGR